MIATVRGKLLYFDFNSVVVECNGVGYEVMVTASVINKGLNIGEELFLYTYLQFSENTGINLFGFANRDEKQLFEKLLSVSGVGAKSAVSILSQLGSEGLLVAVATEDYKSIAKAPGIGNKTAQKIILELKDKIDTKTLMSGEGVNLPAPGTIMTSAVQEACMALTALGFREADCLNAVKSIENADKMDAETILGLALKKLG